MNVCKDVAELALDYIRRELEPSVEQRLERHLAHCPSCINFIRTYEYVPNVSREVLTRQMPESVKSSLRQFLQRELKQECTDAHCSASHDVSIQVSAAPLKRMVG